MRIILLPWQGGRKFPTGERVGVALTKAWAIPGYPHNGGHHGSHLQVSVEVKQTDAIGCSGSHTTDSQGKTSKIPSRKVLRASGKRKTATGIACTNLSTRP